MGDQELKVVLVGPPSSGKTSLIQSFVKGELPYEASASVEVERHNFTTALPMFPNGEVNFTLWDTFDHVQYHNAVLQYCNTAHVCVVVYDVTSAESWVRATEWVEELRALLRTKIAIALVGNKIDRRQRGMEAETALSFAVEHDTLLYECSAKDGSGVQSLFTDIAVSTLRAPSTKAASPRARIRQIINHWRSGVEEKVKSRRQSVMMKRTEKTTNRNSTSSSSSNDNNDIPMTDLSDTACTVKVVLVGEQGVGKTSLAVQFVKGEFNERIAPTISASFLTRRVRLPVDNAVVDINLWDTAGQEKFSCLVPMYFRQAQGAVIVYDVKCLASFKRAKNWAKTIRAEHEHITSVAFVGNKADVSDALRSVPTEEARTFARDLGLTFMEVSAKTGQNVRQVFTEIAAQIDRRSVDVHGDTTNTVTLGTKRHITGLAACCAVF